MPFTAWKHKERNRKIYLLNRTLAGLVTIVVRSNSFIDSEYHSLKSTYKSACGHVDVSTPSFGSHPDTIATRGRRLCQPYTGVHTKF
jgi:hypothetical protein